MNIIKRTSRDFGHSIPLVGTGLVIIVIIYVVVIDHIKLLARLIKLALQPLPLVIASLTILAIAEVLGFVGYKRMAGFCGIVAVPFIALCGLADMIENMSERKSRKADRD